LGSDIASGDNHSHFATGGSYHFLQDGRWSYGPGWFGHNLHAKEQELQGFDDLGVADQQHFFKVFLQNGKG
jgi:hypothetical protein